MAQIIRRRLLLGSAVSALALKPSLTAQADTRFTDFSFAARGASTSRTMPDRLSDIINVKDWGAVGNGVHNDAPNIQAAINFCIDQGGGKVFFPPGSYPVSSAIIVGSRKADAGVQIIGSGGSGVAANTSIGGNISGFIFSKGSETYDNLIHIEACVIKNINTTPGTGAVKLTAPNCSIHSCTLHGMIMLDASQADGCTIFDCVGAGNDHFVNAGNPWPLLEHNAIGFYLGNRCTAIGSRAFAGCYIAFALGGTAASVRGCSTETTAISVRLGWSPLLTLTTNAGAASGTNILSFASFPAGSSPGRGVSGTNIPVGTTIRRIDGNNVVLSANTTGPVVSGATIAFAQENPAIACCIQNFQNEACDTSFDLYNCIGCFVEANSPNPTTGRPAPQAITNLSWSGGTVTATTGTNHNIPVGTHRLLFSGTASAAWTKGEAYIVATSTNPASTTFTYVGPVSNPGSFSGLNAFWTVPLHYGMRFRKVSDTSILSSPVGANLAHSSFDFIYATSATPAGEAEHHNNMIIASTASSGWMLPASKNRASWEFVDCGLEQTVTQNSEAQSMPHPYGFMVFADLPGQAGVLQPLFEGQEYDIIDGNPASAAFDATVTGGGNGHYRVRYNGTNWKRIG